MSADTTTKHKYIKMCRDALRCPIYEECRQINKHNEECQRLGKLNEKKELPKRVEEHMKNFKHIALPICRFHYKSREGSGCNRIHMGDTDDIKDKDGNIIQRCPRGNLCFYDMGCNNPHCHGYHGWKCQYGSGCKNPNCPLAHPTLKDVNGKEIEDGRNHMPDPSYFINYPKKDTTTTKLKIVRPNEIKEDTKPVENTETKQIRKRGRIPKKV